MPEDLEIDYSKYKFIGRTENNTYCFRENGNPLRVLPMAEAFYLEWRKAQGVMPVIDAEGRYICTETDLAQIHAAVTKVMDGRSKEGVKEAHDTIQRIRSRKV